MHNDDRKTHRLSPLGHTWILDLDGTVVKHNGYKADGFDTFLEGAKEFLDAIPQGDMVIFLTSRTEEDARDTELFLHENGVHYDAVIYGAPYGERILVNDCKPSGLRTALAINSRRNHFMSDIFLLQEDL